MTSSRLAIIGVGILLLPGLLHVAAEELESNMIAATIDFNERSPLPRSALRAPLRHETES